jgi:bifunctional DNA-binding transcriptional regulator/antitoxin component of YhaV-PrlF toxin-antitoxin module
MAHVVGPKGQVVISKEIRDRLGVERGWIALQRLVNDHVEVHFLPPEHRKSLKGILAKHARARVGPGKDWDKARETAWVRATEERGEISCRKVGPARTYFNVSKENDQAEPAVKPARGISTGQKTKR